MTKTEFLSASLPYGAKFINKVTYEDAVMLLHGVVFDEVLSQYGKFSIKDAKPIIRPLDSLTKECVQAGYNDGKPFIPIVELAKIADPHSLYVKRIFFSNQLLKKLNSYSVVFYNKGGLSEMYFEYIVDEATFCMIDENGKRLVHNQFRLFQLLLKWHFWINMPESEEVVYVTDEFNPYK